MSDDKLLTIIGQVMVDLTLSHRSDAGARLRLGGLAHAARMAWALDADYEAIFVAPAYLATLASDFLQQHNARRVLRVGDVTGCPYVMVIQHPEEAGDQGYEYVLSDHAEVLMDEAAWAGHFSEYDPTIHDILVLGDSSLLAAAGHMLPEDPGSLVVDIDAPLADLAPLFAQSPHGTLISSTSTALFRSDARRSAEVFFSKALAVARQALLKENRGGSELRNTTGERPEIGAQSRHVQHSIGVGDAFDAAFAVLQGRLPGSTALAYASCLAAEYASTTEPATLKSMVSSVMSIPPDEVTALASTRLPWDERQHCQIYVAAPDFDYIPVRDRLAIDEVAAALRYHNFAVRLPVREGGQVRASSTTQERAVAFASDVALLQEAAMIVAVLPFDDPGTLAEVGMGAQMGVPVVVFDPFQRLHNLFVAGVVECICATLEEVVNATFDVLGRLREGAWRPRVVLRQGDR